MKNAILQQYIRLTEFLGRALGPDYEIVLHDLTVQDRSIIAIANSHVSGRAVGAPLTNAALQILADQSDQACGYRLNDRALSAGNRVLRASAFLIKDEAGRLIGLLCINFDDSRYQELGERVLRLCHPDAFVGMNFAFDETWPSLPPDGASPAESFQSSIGAAVSDAVAAALREIGQTAGPLSQEDKMRVVSQLEAQGIFLLKGAVKDVASELGCSQASVYRYLTRIREQQAAVPQNRKE